MVIHSDVNGLYNRCVMINHLLHSTNADAKLKLQSGQKHVQILRGQLREKILN